MDRKTERKGLLFNRTLIFSNLISSLQENKEMTYIKYLYAWLLSAFVAVGAFAQTPKIELRLVQEVNTTADTLLVDISIRSRLTTPNILAKLGTSDMLFNLNVKALDTANAVIRRTGRFSADSSGFYENPKLISGVDTFMNLRVIRRINPSDTGFYISQNWMFVARIAIPIKGNNACKQNSNIRWRGYTVSGLKAKGVIQNSSDVSFDKSSVIFTNESPSRPLRPAAPKLNISAVPKPNGILFRWRPTSLTVSSLPNVIKYGIMLNESGIWFDTVSATRNYIFIPLASLDSTSLSVRAIVSCDTSYSNVVGARAIPCPTVLGDVTSSAPSVCVGVPLTVSANHNNPKGLVSFDGGVTFGLKKDSVFALIKADTTINVMLQDSFGCKSSITPILVTIKNSLIPTSSVVAVTSNSCTSQIISLSGQVTGGTPSSPITIRWRTNGLGTIADSTVENTTYTPSTSDVGVITFTLYAINQCKEAFSSTSTTMVFSPDASASYYVKGSNAESFFSPSKVIMTEEVFFEVKNPSSAASYKWILGNPLDTSISVNTSFKYTTPGTYKVKLIALNSDASLPKCPDTTVFDIIVEKSVSVYVPNIFSPYATNANDRTFRVFGYIAKDGFNMTVYNKWGAVVFETTDVEEGKRGWNGAKDNSGGDLQSGTYTYSLKGKFLDGTSFDKTGSVVLVR